jgi:membrane protein YdbS with pleckstrin-like domain
MNRESGNVAFSEEQRSLLAKEYRDITQRIAASGTWVWTTLALFVAGAVAAAGFVIAAGGSSRFTFIGVYILGIGVMTILWLFLNLFVRRERWREWVLYWRQREIEGKLNVGASRYIHALDETFGEKQDFSKFPQDLRESLDKLVADKELSYVSPHGSTFLDWAVRITMLVWVAVMVIEFFQWHNHSLLVGYVTLAIGFVWACVMILSCRGVPTCDRKR